MTESLFSNGKAEWIRWLVAMAIGAGTVYASMNARLSVVESQISNQVTQAISALRDDIREVRSAVYTRQATQPPPTEIIDASPPSSRRDDRLPQFPRDERLSGVNR